ncbi:hypothetical protein COV94_03755, partial [Candidatus Woesearchaeota archaeon CG11_big_fil_rev_8_21_14_0_20_57_5]
MMLMVLAVVPSSVQAEPELRGKIAKLIMAEPGAQTLNHHIGAVIFMGADTKDRSGEAIKALTQPYADDGMIVASDMESATVNRLQSICALKAASDMASDTELRAYMKEKGECFRSVGINLDLAPVLDISGTGNEVNARSFGTDAQTVSAAGALYILGLRDAGVGATAKHFPGLYGLSSTRTDTTLVSIQKTESQLDGRELIPFTKAKEAGVYAVMMSSALFPLLDQTDEQKKMPAGINPTLVAKARHIFGTDTVIMTDALNTATFKAYYKDDDYIVKAAVDALRAGNDMVLVMDPAKIDAVITAVEADVTNTQDDTLTQADIDAKY